MTELLIPHIPHVTSLHHISTEFCHCETKTELDIYCVEVNWGTGFII